MKYTTHSEKQTIALGEKLAKQLKGGEVIALIGNLGAGKTTLIKGIARGLGLKKIITSPTFVLMKIYDIDSKIKKLVHIDCYRIKSAEEISAIGAQEYFGQKNTVVVIEWADKIKKLLPRLCRPLRQSSENRRNSGGQARQKIEIKIKLKNKDSREITLK